MSKQDTKTGRWRRLLLVLSLGMNLIVIGVVAGAFLRGGPAGPMQRFDLTVGPLTRAMDEDNRDAVRRALRDSGAFARRDRQEVRADMLALVETLRADRFDAEAFETLLLRQRQRLQGAQDAVTTVVSAQISDMSDAERAAFADRLEEQLRRAPPTRRDRPTRSGG